MQWNRRLSLMALATGLGLVSAACAAGPVDGAPAAAAPSTAVAQLGEPTRFPPPTAVPALPRPEIESREDPNVIQDRPGFTTEEWSTNFDKRSISYLELASGGPPKDGIPAIDEPKHDTVQQANEWMEDREPVLALTLGGESRAYPLHILIWHEIVNDELGGVPATVTYCPLCNSALVFDRRFEGRMLDFGTTGKLRLSDLVMYDRQTESWWQQLTGEAIIGDLTGGQLTFIPAPLVAWSDFKSEHPEGTVLSRDTGHSRRYGENPYGFYDTRDKPMVFYRGPDDARLQAMERVLAVDHDGLSLAIPFSLITEEGVIPFELGDLEAVAFHQSGTASALDTFWLPGGRDVGSTNVFVPVIDGQALTFASTESGFLDTETGSSWTILGRAVSGPLEGAQLTQVPHGNHFWFAWAASPTRSSTGVSPNGLTRNLFRPSPHSLPRQEGGGIGYGALHTTGKWAPPPLTPRLFHLPARSILPGRATESFHRGPVRAPPERVQGAPCTRWSSPRRAAILWPVSPTARKGGWPWARLTEEWRS